VSCLDSQAIARVAAGEPPPDHVDQCLTCRRLVDDQQAMRRLAQRLAAPTLTRERRQRIAAEVLAAADLLPVRRRRIPIAAGGVAFAAAAAAVVVWIRSGAPSSEVVAPPELSAKVHRDPLHADDRVVAMLEVPAPLTPARIEELQTHVIHEVRGGRDVLSLADGVITIDSRDARDVDVRVADTIVHVNTARARVHARAGAILSVQVIAGSAEVETPSRHVLVEPETTWFAEPTREQLSVRAFRDGWVALRDGRNAIAIGLFDRATDRAVAEDAAYWGAVAAVRAGDPSAAHRLAEFVRRFPSSPRASQATRFLDGVPHATP
jgi:hypothetical protein